MSDPETDSLALDFGGLSIRTSKTSDRRRESAPASQSSFQVISPSSSSAPRLGALPSPERGTGDQVVEAWSEEWSQALLEATTPEALESLDLSPVNHLLGRLRARTGTSGWTPAARLGRALRAGLVPRYKLDHEEGAFQPSPDTPHSNRCYVVLRSARRQASGTEDHSTFLAAVRGPYTSIHPDAVCHAFPSRAEGEAFCLGAGRIWPAPLRPLA